MAKKEYGVFTPTEAAYTQPGSWEAMATGAALGKARELSTIDIAYYQGEIEKEISELMAKIKREEIASREKMAGEELAWMREQELGPEREGGRFGMLLGGRGVPTGGAGGRLGLERERLQTQKYLGRLGAAPAGAPGTFPGWEEYMEKPEEPEITMDWLTQQLEKMYS